ncbi:hypothetical protein [Sandaracinus amylolyticus]|uniref:Uncharacterized protein n=1 Tax=Sandaracinus amylolyticus TaxID=927083 RepID=A0A0F6YL82_9BACT|nr:hypothetical protein [Sandaracinus amylolyticus]AKF09585.1 hypothetical protein DB32_006734 [Sandaracinus amylolyticus]
MDDTLAREVAGRIERRWPHARVDVTSVSSITVRLPDARSIDLRLDRLRTHLASCPGDRERDQAVAMFMQTVADAIEPPPDRVEDVIATLRSRELVQFALRGCISRPLAGDLTIVYGVDRPASTLFPTAQALGALGLIDPARLHDVALANLAARLPPADAFEDLPGHPGVYVRDVGDLHECDRLLLTPQWPVIEEALGGSMLAAAPARGVLLIAAAPQVDSLFDATHAIAMRHPEPLGRAILRWESAGWRVNL